MCKPNENKALQLRKFEKVCEILEKYDHQPSKLIPILQDVQHEYRYLPEEVLSFLATGLKLSPARVYGVATFYSHFALKPKGKYVIRLCDGTACHVKDSLVIHEALQKHLGLAEGQETTPDLLFTLEKVSCLGACGLAPVVVINGDVHGQVTPQQAVALVEEIKAREEVLVK